MLLMYDPKVLENKNKIPNSILARMELHFLDSFDPTKVFFILITTNVKFQISMWN